MKERKGKVTEVEKKAEVKEIGAEEEKKAEGKEKGAESVPSSSWVLNYTTYRGGHARYFPLWGQSEGWFTKRQGQHFFGKKDSF